MTKKKEFAPWKAAVPLLVLSLGGIVFSAIRFSSYVFLGGAAVAFCYQLLCFLEKRTPKTAKILRRILTAVLCVLLIAALITEIVILHAGRGSKDRACDYLIVLGAGVNGTVPSLTLQERLNAAYDYLTEYPDAVCVVSGGQGPGEDITEAECMSRYLTQRGIDGSRILLEDQATSTQENLAYSAAILAQHTGTATTTVAIVSNEYHLFRAGQMAKDQGLTPVLVPARTQLAPLWVNYHVREVFALWYYLIIGG